MANKQVNLQVITPERKALDVQTESVVIPAHDGELGILASRAPLMCELGVGELRYRDGATTRRMFVDGGFAQVNRDRVTILTENAAAPEEITAEMIDKAAKATAAAVGEERPRARRRLHVLRELQGAR